MSRNPLARIVVILLVACVLAACKPKSATPVVLMYLPNPFAPSSTPEPTLVMPTVLHLPTATLTPRPTQQPSPTPVVTLPPSPTPTAGPPLGCPDLHGSIEKSTVQEVGQSEPMDVNIYLPPCYDKNYPGGYAVLYLIHGQTSDYEQWIHLGMTETADIYFSSGKLKPFMMVMPHENNYNQDWPDSSFDTDLLKSVVPWVDAHYRTCSQRSCRGIGGISRGALWAVAIGLSHWQTFGVIGAHSLPGPPYPEANTVNFFKAMQPQGYSRVYVDIGSSDDFLPRTELFVDYLKKHNLPFEWHLNPGAHNDIYWEAHLSEYLAWYGHALYP